MKGEKNMYEMAVLAALGGFVIVKACLQTVDGIVGHHGGNHRILTGGRDSNDAGLHVLSALDVTGQSFDSTVFFFSQQDVARG